MTTMTTHPTDTPLGTLPPRTRAALCLTEDNGKLRIMNLSGCGLIVRAEFAATLETELNEATALLRQKDELLEKIACYRGEGSINTPWQAIVKDCGQYAREALALTPKSPTP